jgi:hypothetical protein
MRHPTTHSFLKWAGPSFILFCGGCVGLEAALAPTYPGIKQWGEDWFLYALSVMTAPWFVILSIALITGYIWALVWTGKETGKGPSVDPVVVEQHTHFHFYEAVKSIWNKIVPVALQFEAHSVPSLEMVITRALRRDVGVAEALAYAEFKEWGGTFFEAASSAKNEANEQLVRFRQLAHDGVLKVWGKRSVNGVFEIIPKEHWLDHNVEWFDLLRGNPRTENVLHTTPQPYSELMVSKAEFEREWSPHDRSMDQATRQATLAVEKMAEAATTIADNAKDEKRTRARARMRRIAEGRE